MMRRPGGEDLSDGAVIAVVGTAGIVLALLWLWGGIAGLAFGRGWPQVHFGQLVSILIRLPSRLSDPAQAWPQAARTDLPGAAGLYGALAVILAGAGALIAVASRAGEATLSRRPPGAHWARGGELRTLTGTGKSLGDRGIIRRRSGEAPRPRTGARIALGRRRRRVLYGEHRHALIAFGPPQSGKSAGIAVPALLEWPGPAVASSIKTDLLSVTRQRRDALGSVFVFDPFRLGGGGGHTWSPLRGAGTWDGALEVAWRLASAAEVDQRGVEGGDFWAIAAEQRLAPLLFAAARTGRTIGDVVRWAYGQGMRDFRGALATINNQAGNPEEIAGARAASDAVHAFEAQADRTRSSIEATAQTLLRAYRFTRVEQSARSCEITPERLLEESATLYLIGDAKASKLLRPIFLALLGEVIDAAYERATRAGGALERPLLVCLDEAGNVAPLPNLAEIASTAPSHNIQLVSIFHDLAQARARYGRQAETVVNSHRARMLLTGVADLDTLRYFAGLVGEEEAKDLSRSTGPGGATRSTARRRRPLVAAELLRQLPDRRALLLYGRLAPTEVRLRLWFEDRRLRRLAG